MTKNHVTHIPHSDWKDVGKQKRKRVKVNMERNFQNIQDLWKDNKCQLEDRKDELNQTNQRIEEAEGRIGTVETQL